MKPYEQMKNKLISLEDIDPEFGKQIGSKKKKNKDVNKTMS
jgi:hypothetical protein